MPERAASGVEPALLPAEFTPERLRVAVIGAGNIGAGVALLFARRGYRVSMFNQSPRGRDRAFAWIATSLAILVEAGVETESGAEAALGRITGCFELEEAATGAGYVLETVPEDLELKREIVARLDAICPPPAILATGTSGLGVTRIAQNTANPQRVIGTHHFTPPHLVPGVEVVSGKETSPETTDVTCALLRHLGRRPVQVPDVPGLIAGRLSCALRREAWAIVEEGLAGPEEVDELWRSTVGLLYVALGPLQVSDVSGLDVLLAVHEYVEHVLRPPSRPSAMVREKVAAGELGLKTGRGFYEWPPENIEQLSRRRDALLLAILRAQQAEGS